MPTGLPTALGLTRETFEEALSVLLVRHGAAPGEALRAHLRSAVDGMLEALDETADDGASLAPIDVVRIRANKLAAVQLPAALWRDPRELARVRADILAAARRWLGPEAGRGSRFGS